VLPGERLHDAGVARPPAGGRRGVLIEYSLLPPPR
jgi:hypothetical protein